MDNDFEIIGIDHGWSMVKTSSQVFVTGVKEITTEPGMFDDVLELDGKYYKIGGVRLEVRDVKIENDNLILSISLYTFSSRMFELCSIL